MTFGDLVGLVNEAALDSFGDDFTFTRVNSIPAGEELTITAILDAGVQLENVPPGDGSAYALLWLQDSDIDPGPAEGDEVSSLTTVYKVVRIEKDAGAGLRMLLRQDRAL